MLSIESRFFASEMREAARRCFVQVGLPFDPYGQLATTGDYRCAALEARIGPRMLTARCASISATG